MKAFTIVLDGDPLLKTKCAEVPSSMFKTRYLRDVVARMFHTLEKSKTGIALAANQVGITSRIMVIDTRSGKYPDGIRAALINPVLLESEGEHEAGDEGCLSYPGVSLSIKRSPVVTVSYSNIDGHVQTKQFDGMTARCFLHELDHLEGVTFRERI